MKHRQAFSLTMLAVAAALAGCASTPTTPPEMRTVSIQRTAYGVPHISAPDLETLAYGVAYAHAEDNFCMTAQQLVTVRGERSRYFGGAPTGLLGRRMFPNEWVDFFIAGHMDDAALAASWGRASADTQAMVRGYVAGYNRYLQDKAADLPPACKGQPWVQPMTTAHYYRLTEVANVQAGIGALADAMLAAQPPKPTSGQAPTGAVQMADAVQALREAGLVDSPLGSNAWAFGTASTANGSGLLLGNPHFPWAGVNRFWQMHLTVPGRMDVMGAATGHSPVVQIGFNKDVAWSHTVSSGKRFTLHELKLVPGDPTSYLVDGQPEKMRSRALQIAVRGGDGHLTNKPLTLWSTRWGPVVVMPRVGLNWTTTLAYALQDANSGNSRSIDTWLASASATSTMDLRKAMGNLGLPWVNTIAADRQGTAMYADLSVVPDVDESQIARCAPSPQAAALRGPAGLIVLDGSRSDCAWKRDPASAVPGLMPAGRMPVAIRSDWVQNSNDSFFYTNPQQSWSGISPMVGDDIVRRPRTRSSLIELPELVARGPVT
ncbi:MAG TPA: penicillin acylase family protein, partial [Rubrivivax sp.]|nr:penicillin acylase family protein [Rubrivivax sp.]